MRNQDVNKRQLQKCYKSTKQYTECGYPVRDHLVFIEIVNFKWSDFGIFAMKTVWDTTEIFKTHMWKYQHLFPHNIFFKRKEI